MAFVFKKEKKEFYMPKNKPEIVTVPKVNYIAIRGKGNPNVIRIELSFCQLNKEKLNESNPSPKV